MHLRDGDVAIGGSISHMSATHQTASVMCMSRVSALILETFTCSRIVIGMHYGPGICSSGFPEAQVSSSGERRETSSGYSAVRGLSHVHNRAPLTCWHRLILPRYPFSHIWS